MELSLLITDNYNLDTIDAPMMMYAKADLCSFQKKNILKLSFFMTPSCQHIKVMIFQMKSILENTKYIFRKIVWS